MYDDDITVSSCVLLLIPLVLAPRCVYIVRSNNGGKMGGPRTVGVLLLLLDFLLPRINATKKTQTHTCLFLRINFLHLSRCECVSLTSVLFSPSCFCGMGCPPFKFLFLVQNFGIFSSLFQVHESKPKCSFLVCKNLSSSHIPSTRLLQNSQKGTVLFTYYFQFLNRFENNNKKLQERPLMFVFFLLRLSDLTQD